MATELVEEVKAAVEHIEDVSIEQILEEAIEIKRVQTLSCGKWETMNYILVLTVGGPHLELDVGRSVVDGYWYSEEAHLPVDSDKTREIYDYLDEVYSQ